MVQLGGERSGNIPDCGWEAAAGSVKGARRRRRRGVGTGREVPPRAGVPRGRRFQAHFRTGKAGRLESTGVQAASGSCVRPVAGVELRQLEGDASSDRLPDRNPRNHNHRCTYELTGSCRNGYEIAGGAGVRPDHGVRPRSPV